jgi:hypothetical protein
MSLNCSLSYEFIKKTFLTAPNETKSTSQTTGGGRRYLFRGREAFLDSFALAYCPASAISKCSPRIDSGMIGITTTYTRGI